jgi:hypothetical protein
MRGEVMHRKVMRGKVVWLAVITLLLTLWVGAGAALAQDSENFNLTLNSWAGGNYGGTTVSSASYSMVISAGTMIKVQSTSAGYQLCSGFICQSDKGFFQIRLPAVEKVAE